MSIIKTTIKTGNYNPDYIQNPLSLNLNVYL